jgi:multidrug transporter EmrE-like cation transporter
MKGSTPLQSLLMIFSAAWFGAFGSYLYKSGAELAKGGGIGALFNIRILSGVTCYIAVMVLFISAFRKGGELTVLYPAYASTFIFAALIARFAYGTPIAPINIAGMLLLLAGMYLMGVSA